MQLAAANTVEIKIELNRYRGKTPSVNISR